MKYIIIGLGNFGVSLGTTLFEQGHEVIGIDRREMIVEEFKNVLTSTVCLDSVVEVALKSQPINDVDAVIVAIGEDWAASIQTVALLKKLGVKRIIGRSLSELHEVVLGGLGVTEIINPELTAARVIADHIISKNVVYTFDLTNDVSVNEIEIPSLFVGQTIKDLDLKTRFSLKIFAIKHAEMEVGVLAKYRQTNWKIITDFDENYQFSSGDHIVICGEKKQISRMLDLIK